MFVGHVGGDDQQRVSVGTVLPLVVLPGFQDSEQRALVGDADTAAVFLRRDTELPVTVDIAAVDEQQPPSFRLGQPVFDERFQHAPVDFGCGVHSALSSPPTVRHRISISAPGCSRA